MIDRRDSFSETTIDPDVRDAYRRTAVEATPACLDKQILQLSRQPSHNRSRTSKSDFWTRPLAFAAMAVLALAVALQFLGVGFVEIGPGLSTGPGSKQPRVPVEQTDDLAAAVESTGQRLRELDSQAEGLTSNNKPMPTSGPYSGHNPDSSRQTSIALSNHCETESRISADSWWSCIQELQRDRLDDAARSELDLFNTAHPSFDTNR